MKRIFLDTNILVDLICCRKPFIQEAEQIFVLADMKKISIGISALSYINTVYIARKYNFSVPEVIESLKKIASFVSITDLSESVIKQAMDCGWKDFEDAAQYHSSLSFSPDYIITRNPKDFAKSTVPVYAPAEFLQILYGLDESDNMLLNEPEVEYQSNKRGNDILLDTICHSDDRREEESR